MLKMYLNPSPHDPCLLYGVPSNTYSPDTIYIVQSHLHIGLYVDDFVFYYSDTTKEALLKKLLQEHTKVNFIGRC